MNSPPQQKFYIGRFAPSPSGPLHFGSLVCALGSYLDAQAHGGHWLVRMEDLDPPREQPGAANQILHTLEAHGLHWHGPLEWQSKRLHLYDQTLETLAERGLTYRCHCSREQIRRNGGHDNQRCKTQFSAHGASDTDKPFALRLSCAGSVQAFDDFWHGHQRQEISEDPILKRRDGYFAYQLAVVVDDLAQDITHIVRGADLLDCTGVQLQLFQALEAKPPQFGHLPLVMNTHGQKLSKQNQAAPLDDKLAGSNLISALRFLGFHPPAELTGETPATILHWAAARWQRQQVDLRDRQLH